jgi:ABC-type xylose transport system permease subunit
MRPASANLYGSPWRSGRWRSHGAVNGLLVIVSRVPDVIVTLTTGFIWGGVALLILEKPGGGASSQFADLGTGTMITEWLSTRWFCLSYPWRSYGFGSHVEDRPAHLRHRQMKRSPRFEAA